jgi:hypothetical protein
MSHCARLVIIPQQTFESYGEIVALTKGFAITMCSLSNEGRELGYNFKYSTV